MKLNPINFIAFVLLVAKEFYLVIYYNVVQFLLLYIVQYVYRLFVHTIH